jgi:hypothetical protein
MLPVLRKSIRLAAITGEVPFNLLDRGSILCGYLTLALGIGDGAQEQRQPRRGEDCRLLLN